MQVRDLQLGTNSFNLSEKEETCGFLLNFLGLTPLNALMSRNSSSPLRSVQSGGLRNPES